MTTTYTASGNAHPISWVPLNKLVPWDGNVRKTGAADGLEELTASIAAHGVLQSLVVRKNHRGKYAVVAGRRRFLALSSLAEGGSIEADAPVPCRVLARSADATEISLTENVVRAPMHPADQFEAFSALIEAGASVTDVAARFGISETAVRLRLKLARVSPGVFAAYRAGELTLEQVQAFTVSDDHAAQDRVRAELSECESFDASDIRAALRRDAIPATDRRARFVTVAAYETAGGAVQRDLFAEGDHGVFLLDGALLDRLAMEKLQASTENLKAEGWKWIEAVPELDYAARGDFRVRRPEPLPLSEEAEAEQRDLSEEYERLYNGLEDGDEETSQRLDAIEARIGELQETERSYTPDVLAIAGAIVTIGADGGPEILRGIVRPEDEPDAEATADVAKPPRPEFSAALVESLTEAKTAAIGATLAAQPRIALAAVVHALAGDLFTYGSHGSLRLSAETKRLREPSKGACELDQAREQWAERVPGSSADLWQWCLEQEQDTLLDLLAYCAARAVNAVQMKHDRPEGLRLTHANSLATALKLDMAEWFTPTAANFFSRVGRTTIMNAMAEAKSTPVKRSWAKLTKAALAAEAEREIAGTGWLPLPIRA